MPIKYKPGNEPISLGNSVDRWEVPQRSVKITRRRLLYINSGLLLMVVALIFYASMDRQRDHRWLPVRPGEGEIIDKSISDNGSEPQYFIEVSISVPPAEPSEAALVTEETPERDERVGALSLSHRMRVAEPEWSAVKVGQRVHVMYQINSQRTGVFVDKMRPFG